MRTTEAARYARWSAIIAGLLLLIVSGVYLRNAWQARQAEKLAPPSVPPSVEQRSAKFSFSKVAGDRTLFTVRASRATEFKKGDRSLLEDVWITVYGNRGRRFDNLHTQSCDYIPVTGEIRCAGEVQIDLQSASDARLHPSSPGKPDPDARVLHVGTSHVSFNRETGVAATNQPVEFRFPQGEGRAVGIRYDSGEGRMRLLHDVHLTLRPPGSTGMAANSTDVEEVNISGGALVYRRGDRVLHLLGPVAVHQGTRELSAGELDLELDADLRAQRIVASGHPEVRMTASGAPLTASAEQFWALLSPGGRIRQIIASGNVRGSVKGTGGEERLAADRVEEEFLDGTARPAGLTATGNVTAVSVRAGGGSWRLTTSRLALAFAGDGDRVRLDRAATPAGILDWVGPPQAAGGSKAQQMRLKAQQLDAGFDEADELRELHATGGVEVERKMAGAIPVTSRSNELVAHLTSGGDWSEVEQSGDVHLRQGKRIAEASRARFERASDKVTLSGPVNLSDPVSHTTAHSAVYGEAANELRAEGGVVTSERPAGSDGVTNFASGPAHISADRLTVGTTKGRAIYSGHARLWQGDSIIEADSIELDRTGRTLTATGHVRAVFPKAPWEPPAGSPAGQPRAVPDPLRAEAGLMVYSGSEGRARLSRGVVAQTGGGSMRSDSMELVFAPGKPTGTAKAGKMVAVGSQELTRLEAMGSVVVGQGGRRATAEHGEYSAAEGKFVLSGGHPTIYDDSGNAVTGRQLTFFFADDRIVVDSEEGSRTLTLHRVER